MRPVVSERPAALRCRLFCCLLLLAAIAGCARQAEQELDGPIFEGPTMGTFYRVKLDAVPAGTDRQQIGAAIEATLERINARMSTYRADSELSRFNAATADAGWFAVSRETAAVVRRAIEISDQSGGAFDATAGPLVNLWGFGPGGGERRVPDRQAIFDTLSTVGYHQLEVRLDPPALRKRVDGLYVDLSGIAKGHGVDAIAQLLADRGVRGYFIDIGGEHRAHGTRPDGSSWTTAIELPSERKREIRLALPLNDSAIATSGDYRNFFEVDGRRYAHIVDPRSGEATAGTLGSVSVLAGDCATADALATAMMVMGAADARQFAEDEDLAVLLIERDGDGWIEHRSSRFRTRFPDLEE